MIYRTLGATGLKVSAIGMGTWQLGGEWGKSFTSAEVADIFDAARAEGITLVDTAECYGDHLSERLVGEQVRHDRDRWVIATKFGHGYTGNGQRDQLWTPADVERQLEASLAALGIDTIDLYQFHSGTNQAFDNDELWTMLDRQKRAGKLRHLGISIGGSIPIADRLHQVRRAKQVGAGCLQVLYNRLDRWAEPELLPLARAEGLGFLARVPLASGFLSGKYDETASFPAGDHRAGKKPGEIAEMAREAARIRREEVPAGVDMAAWAIAWCLKTDGVTSAIPGCKSPQHVRKNAAASALIDS
jgi:aryl-alcohol dehydrogenase-like predicted oxidoreductase